MVTTLMAKPLTRDSFARFGDVIDFDTDNHYPINDGRCERYHALARPEAGGQDGHVIINLFRATPYSLPLRLSVVERHPLGSQAFIPLSPEPFLVVVCEDGPQGPQTPQAFLTAPGQGVNYRRNLWHGAIMPIGKTQDFVVVDRDGAGVNVALFHFPVPFDVVLPDGVNG